jgi:hypothetical protein
MSADAYADVEGRFTIIIQPYNGGRQGSVTMDGLKPFEPMRVELYEGTDYLPDPPQEEPVMRTVSTSTPRNIGKLW